MNRRLLIGSLAIALTSSSALPQSCPSEPYELVMPPALNAGDDYGAAVAVCGDWLFVGAPMDDQLETNAGAVYVFQLEGGLYEFRQKLMATGGVGPAHFGNALGAHQGILIVGAENDQEIAQSSPSASGAAYIFRFDGTQWTQEQKLFAFGPGDAQQFGHAVAIEGNIAAVSAHAVLSDGVSGIGAAYVYQFRESAWTNVQRLAAPSPSPNDAFGASLALTAGVILVGSPGNDQADVDAGAVFFYTQDGGVWVHMGTLLADDGHAGARFATSIAVDGAWLAIGAPMDVVSGMTSGAVYVFRLVSGTWTSRQKLLPANAAAGDGFGSSVAMAGPQLLVGSPTKSLIQGGGQHAQAGAAYIYELEGDQWSISRIVATVQEVSSQGYGPYVCWLNGPQPLSGWPQSLAFTRLGRRTAISTAGFIVGSELVRARCWGFEGPHDSGAVNLFAPTFAPSDCNFNGTPDVCDTEADCNANYIPDSCELNAGTSVDCNQNSAPDECEAQLVYAYHNSPVPFPWYSSPANGNADFIWLNQYRVKPGGQVVTHIVLQTSSYLPAGTPVKVMLYADPNNDGQPDDAALLAEAETTSLSYAAYPARFLYVSIPPTYIGETDKFFFVGAVLHQIYLNAFTHPWAAAFCHPNGTDYWRSWRAFAPPGQADIYNLMNNANPIHIWSDGSCVVNAIASDCNGNGTWDACEIANGEVPDVNGNGIPDSCEVTACRWQDIAPSGGDGLVNVIDLLEVITHWGFCSPCYAICPGDTNEDCFVNVHDLLLVINSWGPCP